MNAKFVTFYSFKGGVGRSFLLANVACALARTGAKVLCIDWDLEAPGLSQFFCEGKQSSYRGLLYWIDRYRETTESDWRDHISLPNRSGYLFPSGLEVMFAGEVDSNYLRILNGLDYDRLYKQYGFGDILEEVRDEWKETYDYILIDSRTGLTDVGGICCAHLADVVVLVYAANKQNIFGTKDVVQRITRQREDLAYDRLPLVYLPVLSKFEARTEYEESVVWQTIAENNLGELLDFTGLPPSKRTALFQQLIVPYIPKWSYGEELPVLLEPDISPERVSFYVSQIRDIIRITLEDSELEGGFLERVQEIRGLTVDEDTNDDPRYMTIKTSKPSWFKRFGIPALCVCLVVVAALWMRSIGAQKKSLDVPVTTGVPKVTDTSPPPTRGFQRYASTIDGFTVLFPEGSDWSAPMRRAGPDDRTYITEVVGPKGSVIRIESTPESSSSPAEALKSIEQTERNLAKRKPGYINYLGPQIVGDSHGNLIEWEYGYKDETVLEIGFVRRRNIYANFGGHGLALSLMSAAEDYEDLKPLFEEVKKSLAPLSKDPHK